MMFTKNKEGAVPAKVEEVKFDYFLLENLRVTKKIIYLGLYEYQSKLVQCKFIKLSNNFIRNVL